MGKYKKLEIMVVALQMQAERTVARLRDAEEMTESLTKRMIQGDCEHQFEFKEKAKFWASTGYDFICSKCGTRTRKYANELTEPERAYLESLGYLALQKPKAKKSK